MKPTNHELEAMTIRRARVADAGKVRYRVYKNPAEFVAVIAESALMAVKVSGVDKPYKIMRDLPTDGVAIEAQKMAPRDEQAEKVPFATMNAEKPAQYMAELPEKETAPKTPFIPVGIAELQRKGESRMRILSPDMVNQIIEEHAKQAVQTPEPEMPLETVLVTPAEPMQSQEEKLSQMANEMLPSAQEVGEPAVSSTETLSPEEVEKLLNG